MQSLLSEALTFSLEGAAAWLGTSASQPLLIVFAAAISLVCERPELGFSGKNRQLFTNTSSILPPSSGSHAPKYFLRSGDGPIDQTYFELIPTRCFGQMSEGTSLFSEDPCKFSRYFLPLVFCFHELL